MYIVDHFQGPRLNLPACHWARSSYDALTDGMICTAASYLGIVLPSDTESARSVDEIGWWETPLPSQKQGIFRLESKWGSEVALVHHTWTRLEI